MSIKTFKRVEKKFLITTQQYRAVCAAALQHMQPDDYSPGESFYPIYNLYYDTPHNDIIRSSIAKPYYKEKLRMRSYTPATEGQDKVFLELKKKIGGVVSKRRAKLSLQQASALIKQGQLPTQTSYVNAQVSREIACFLQQYNVAPKVFISYKRKALFGIDDPHLRVTFDTDIRTRRSCLSLSPSPIDAPLLQQGQYLMEVKMRGAMPLWLAETLSQNHIYSQGFSKYGTEYKNHLLQLRTAQLPTYERSKTAC